LFVCQSANFGPNIRKKNELPRHKQRGIKSKEIKILANAITKRREIY